MITVNELHREPIPSSQRDMTPIVFAVIDDNLTRIGLDLLIRDAGWRPRTFTSSHEFLQLPHASVPSCLILDVTRLGLAALEIQRRIAAERPDMPIIVITGNVNFLLTVGAMKAGAVEFLTKPLDGRALLQAIENALERSNAVLDHEAKIRELRERYASLSGREREVMTLVVTGLLNKQVGVELGISEVTVKAHRGRVMRKMHANSLPGLVMMAAQLRDALAPIGDRPSKWAA